MAEAFLTKDLVFWVEPLLKEYYNVVLNDKPCQQRKKLVRMTSFTINTKKSNLGNDTKMALSGRSHRGLNYHLWYIKSILKSSQLRTHIHHPDHGIYPEPPYFPLFSLMIITTYNLIFLVFGIKSIRKSY
jgi:hypothetical protein